MKIQENKTITNFVIAAAVLFFVAACLIIIRFVVDDSFISLIYARNFSRYGELVANLGERTFGYTNFLFVVIESLLILVFGKILTGYNIIFAVKLFSFTSAILCLFLGWRYTAIKKNRFATAFWFVSVATSTPFIIWTMAGLETVFVAFLLLTSVVCYLQLPHIVKRNHQLLLEAGMLLSLTGAVLTRLDTILIILPLLIVYAFEQRPVWKRGTKIFLYFVLPLAIFEMWLYSYYGKWLPNPFYFKAFKGNQLYGILYFFQFLILLNANFVHLILIFLGIKRAGHSDGPSSVAMRRYAPILIGVLIYIFYIINQGAVHMMFTYRFYTPLIPLIYLGSALGVSALLEERTERARTVNAPNRAKFAFFLFFLNLTFFLGLVVLWGSQTFRFHSPQILALFETNVLAVSFMALIAVIFSAVLAFPKRPTFASLQPYEEFNPTKRTIVERVANTINKKNILIITLGIFILNVASFTYAYTVNMNLERSLSWAPSANLHTLSISEYTHFMGIFKDAGTTLHELVTRDTNIYSWSAGIIPYLVDAYSFDNLMLATAETSKLKPSRDNLFNSFEIVVNSCVEKDPIPGFTIIQRFPDDETVKQSHDALAKGLHFICIYSNNPQAPN